MGQITIIRKNGTQTKLFTTDPFCAVSQAVQNFTLMGDDNVQLTIKSAEMFDFSIGDKIIVGSDEYSIRTKATREILSDNIYSYDVVFYGVMYELMKSLYRDTDANGVSSKSTFDLTYSLNDFVKVIIYNVNRDYPGIWVFDEENCPETEPKTIQFSKQNCLQVLQNVCKIFDYEFRISQNNGIRTIQVGKFGSIINPPGGKSFFEWGKGSGLYKLKEQKIDDRSIITRLWVEGGTKNIRSDYRGYSDRLQLPLYRKNNNPHTLADGTIISAQSEYIGIVSDANRYIEDADLKNQIGSIEDTEYFDDIIPVRTGTVTALGTDLYSFVDSTMDFDLTETNTDGSTKWLINGVSAKINFITGKLAGQQFELKEKDGYTHSTKTFSIIKYTDERGLSIPTEDSEAYRIGVGDKYKITDINLPDSYVNNAEEDLWYAGYEKFIDRKQARAQYVLTFDRMYFINSMPDDSESSVFKVGDYVPVKDERFNLEKNIRIQKLARNLLLEHDYVLTLSDATVISIQTQTVLDVLEHNIIIENNRLRDLNKARRGWRTTEELRTMVYDTDGYFDADNIRPNSIDTNMLTVGSKSQQFILLNTILQANVNGLPNRFDVSSGILAHLTIDDPNIRMWNMSGTSVTLSNSGGYYVFAKCSKAGDTGVYYVTQQQMKVEETTDPNNYYFQVGIIGSLHTDDNFRDFVTTYGFTRINGNTITTGKIVTSDGQCYLDLDGNKFRIGDVSSSIDWNVTAQNQLTLRNVKLLSLSGDMSNLGVFRGVYNATYTYYPGDEVTYTANGSTSTYRQIHPTSSSKNIPPTNGTYWAIVAQGAAGTNGTDGAYFEYRYAKNGSTSTPPTLSVTTAVPSGWTTTLPTAGTGEYVWCTISKKSAAGALVQNWSTPIRVNGADGAKGDKGDKGENPVMVFRGTYDSSKTYYGNNSRLDCVVYSGVYYIARIDAGTFSGVAPTSTSKWNTFGAQFESIATNLLLAENATIADWIIKTGKITSQNTTRDGTPRAQLDGANGGVTFASDISTYTTSGGSQTVKQTIKIDSQTGQVEARATNDTSYINSQGIFTNKAGIQALPASSGIELKAAMVALGYGNLQKDAYSNLGAICGVYGIASNSNSNPAPSYGGYFRKLFIAGMFLNPRKITSTTYLTELDTMVIGYSSSQLSVYLPTNNVEGRTIFFKQWQGGSMRIYTQDSDNVIYDDTSENTYYDIVEGWMGICTFIRMSINSVSKGIWLINKFKF